MKKFDKAILEKAHFCRRGNTYFSGTHLILDMWDAKHLGDLEVVKAAFEEAIKECGATLLFMDFHHFGEGCGVSGVAVLQESHISIHSFPEIGYAALDVYLCGNLDPMKCVPSFEKHFETDNVMIQELLRGVVG